MTPVRDGRGEISHFVSVKRDVSNRRRFEEQLRQSQKMEAVGRLAGGVAHDFNNLLGVIMGYGEILKRRIPAADPLQGKVTEILKAAERAAGLTRQLLAFSRKQVLQPRVLDLNLVVADMDKMLRRLIGEDIELKTSLREPLGSVRADPGQIEQVLMNLVVNARDAMPGGGSLLIETAAVDLDASYLALHPGALPGPHVLLAVSDTGAGHGQGDGLPDLRALLHDQGGREGDGPRPVHGLRDRRAERRPRRRLQREGTGHDLQGLPAADRGHGGARGAWTSRGAPPRAGSETILLVEDEPALRSMIREILAEAGYRVLEAGTPRQALDVAGAHDGPIHAVLTDVDHARDERTGARRAARAASTGGAGGLHVGLHRRRDRPSWPARSGNPLPPEAVHGGRAALEPPRGLGRGREDTSVRDVRPDVEEVVERA